jgi:sulfoacetaldehyde acetyltransferase
MDETTKAIKQSCEDQKKGITTFIEIILNQELGEPFRRDAMKKPVKVAGINKDDMIPQKVKLKNL